MKKAALSFTVATIGATALFIGTATPVQAAPAWDKSVKCEQQDAEGYNIPTRVGNSELGWRHFSGNHNIKQCKVVNIALKNYPVGRDGSRRTYEGFVIGKEGHIKVTVIVQYARKTSDGRYDAGRGQRIGVITAYCEGGDSRNKCPAWVNK
ncbi:hypothetical protein ABZ442_20160 [Streptomyces triculaminicus]|uniref:hypothetical protein n=1 Tax=Streptomyces triculaminicus TaxID=2816232 RepID=UPI0033FA6992